MDKLQALREACGHEQVILFVGAGVSQVLGVPPWRDLIDHMTRELGLSPEAGRDNMSYRTLAEYFRLKRGSIGPLREWMERQWNDGALTVHGSRVHELIAKGPFRIVYTTNYDR